jgi:hypothetical protein
MNEIERRWWFAAPVTGLSVLSTFWLAQELDLGDLFGTLTLPRIVLFFVSYVSFQRLYSRLIWSAALRHFPALLGEKRYNS